MTGTTGQQLDAWKLRERSRWDRAGKELACRSSVATLLRTNFLHQYSSRAYRFFFHVYSQDNSVMQMAFLFSALSQLPCNSCHVDFTQLLKTIQLSSSPSLVFRLFSLQKGQPGKLARIHSPSEEAKLKFYRSYVNSTRGRDLESIFENKPLSVQLKR